MHADVGKPVPAPVVAALVDLEERIVRDMAIFAGDHLRTPRVSLASSSHALRTQCAAAAGPPMGCAYGLRPHSAEPGRKQSTDEAKQSNQTGRSRSQQPTGGRIGVGLLKPQPHLLYDARLEAKHVLLRRDCRDALAVAEAKPHLSACITVSRPAWYSRPEWNTTERASTFSTA